MHKGEKYNNHSVVSHKHCCTNNSESCGVLFKMTFPLTHTRTVCCSIFAIRVGSETGKTFYILNMKRVIKTVNDNDLAS